LLKLDDLLEAAEETEEANELADLLRELAATEASWEALLASDEAE